MQCQQNMAVPKKLLTNELIFVKFVNIFTVKFYAIRLNNIMTLWIIDSGTFEIPYSQSVNVVIAPPIHYFSEFSHCTLS